MPEIQTYNSRIAWIDMAKALAALMVVMAHLLRQGAAADYLAAVSVAAFFVLAGVTLHRHDDVGAWLRRLAGRVVLPYLVVGLVSIVIYRLLGDYAAARLGASIAQTDLMTDILHLFYGSSVGGRMKWNESLWFLPCYVLVMLLAEGIEHLGAAHRQLRVILYLAGGAAGWALISAGLVGLPWHLETALFVLPFCGLGQSLQGTLSIRRARPWATMLVGAGLLCYSIQRFPQVLEHAGGSLSLRAPQLATVGDTYLFLLFSVLGMLYLVWFCANAFPALPILPMVGAHSLDIVLWNKFPVLFLQTVLPVILHGASVWYLGRSDGAALVTVLVLAIPCIALCILWAEAIRRAVAAIRP